MAVESIPVEKFKTGTTIMGIATNVILLAVLLSAPFLVLVQTYIKGLLFLLIAAPAIWYVFIPVAEYLTEVVPPNIFQHILEWVIVGDQLYLTNDVDPVPHLMLTKEEVIRERELRVRTSNAIH